MIDPRYQHFMDQNRGLLAGIPPVAPKTGPQVSFNAATLGPVARPAAPQSGRGAPSAGRPVPPAPSGSKFVLPVSIDSNQVALASFADYVSKNPPPSMPQSTQDVGKMADADRAKWVAWFTAAPAVADYLSARMATTEAATAFLNLDAKIVREKLIIKAYETYKSKYFASAKNHTDLYLEFEKLCGELEKKIQQVADKAAKAWDTAYRGKKPWAPSLPTAEDITKVRAAACQGNPFVGGTYWRVGSGAYTMSDFTAGTTAADLAAVVPAKPLVLPTVTLPAVGPLESKNVDFFTGCSPAYWNTSDMPPKMQKFVQWLNPLSSLPSDYKFGKSKKTNEWIGPAMFAEVADWIAANMLDKLKVIGFVNIFTGKGNTYSFQWVDEQIRQSSLYLYGKESEGIPGVQAQLDQLAAALEKANKVSTAKLGNIPDGFARKYAALLGDQPAQFAIAIVKAAIAQMLAEVAAQDINHNWDLTQLSMYGGQVQQASGDVYKDAMHFAVKMACGQAEQVTETIGGGQVTESKKDSQSAEQDLADIKKTQQETGTATVSPEELAKLQAALKAAQDAQAKAEQELKNQKDAIEIIKANSDADAAHKTIAAIVQKVSPATSPLSGGDKASVFGAYFQANATVSVGGLEVPTTFVCASQLDFVIPAGVAAGKVDVAVTNPGGEEDYKGTIYKKDAVTTTLTGALEYTAPKGGAALPLIAAAIAAVALLRGK